ncbi:MAG: MBL fold metallo-hydrolase [Lachnospiraceae bacterium]|nr:MBL fold metallo-hydrolase [Lachnospiraceae bacterium]
MKNYYTHERISPAVIRIDSRNESAYLVEGSRQAALIDACSGAGNIGDYARSLTRLPLILILTHGHVDHLGGAMSVKKRYLSRLDWELAEEYGSYEVRKAHLLRRPEDGVKIEDIMPEQVCGFEPLEDEQEFDLGGIHLKALPLPGHTPGSMAVLHEEERVLLLGDACNTLTFLFLPASSTVEAYEKTLQNFWEKWSDAFDHVIFSHFEKASREIIKENMKLCRDILDGKSDEQPFQSWHNNLGEELPLIAKRLTGHPRNRQREDGGEGNIIYRRTALWSSY